MTEEALGYARIGEAIESIPLRGFEEREIRTLRIAFALTGVYSQPWGPAFSGDEIAAENSWKP